MKKFVKILSVFMSVVILVTALCVPVSAASIEDTAKAIDSGKKISFTMKERQGLIGYIYYDYKVNLSEKGTLKLTFDTKVNYSKVKVLDSNGNAIKLSSKSVSSGSAIYHTGHYGGYTSLTWNSTVENFKGTLSYKSLEKGTYYIRMWADTKEVKGKTSVSFTYPQEKESETEGKISYLSVTLKKGDTLQLGAVVDGEGTVKWSTSKKAVATVTSKGKITAKSAGTATITAKLGTSSVKIKIKVTE